MAEGALEGGEKFLKKHWPWVAGGVGAALVLYYLSSSSSGTTSASQVVSGSGTLDASNLAALYNSEITAQQETSAQNAAVSAANQQYQLDSEALAVQAQSAAASAQGQYLTSEGTAALDIGQAYATDVQAEALLPAAAIQGADQLGGTALTDAAGITASTISAEGAAVQGFGTAIGGLGASTASMIGNVSSVNAAQSEAATNAVGSVLGMGALALGISSLGKSTTTAPTATTSTAGTAGGDYGGGTVSTATTSTDGDYGGG